VNRFLADDGLPEFYDDLEARDDWWHLMSTAGRRAGAGPRDARRDVARTAG
jgi:hypothetical protein